MGHNPGTKFENERKAAVETRAPEDVLKGIRGNLAAHLAVTPNDTQFLLAQHDAACARIVELDVTLALLTSAESAIVVEEPSTPYDAGAIGVDQIGVTELT